MVAKQGNGKAALEKGGPGYKSTKPFYTVAGRQPE